ncbi:penicillin-binding transpeptidase domain-containing protein [Actinosynnema sp. NPDC020468]|uniref:penicillin-binding transpeptidase domain-containing protein n=1 Tax=Actinosynnema sp. NPDC020468 TaxID=3154488 RepID=UPI0033D4A33C
MDNRKKRRVLLGGGITAVAVVVAGAIAVWPSTPDRVAATSTGTPTVAPPGPDVVAREFTAALAAGGDAARSTDAPQAAKPVIDGVRKGMAGAVFSSVLAAPKRVSDDVATVAADYTWRLPSGAPLTYDEQLELRLADNHWRVHWSPAVLHPQLGENQSLTYAKTTADGAVRGRDGTPVATGFAPQVMTQVTKVAVDTTGTTGYRVAVVDAAGAPVTVLAEQKAEPGKTYTVTLDPKVQAAAQTAVDGVALGSAIVAIQPSTGDVLAVAQNSAASAQGTIATTNFFEPGSTFKIVTATAALTAGTATADTPLACPGEASIGTRTIINENRFDLGTVPLHTAFAASCNTTFAKLAAELPPSALTEAAARFGLGLDYQVAGLTTNTAKVPAAATVPERVESGIGQGTVQVTPFGMALAAATVARGSIPVPQLVREIPTTGGATTALPGGVVAALRSMTGEVVTGGTARDLAGYGGVHGKTGTAQVGDGTTAHGWFVGYQGDVAFAVLVVLGGSSKAAVSVTASFLNGL